MSCLAQDMLELKVLVQICHRETKRSYFGQCFGDVLVLITILALEKLTQQSEANILVQFAI